MLKNEPDRQSVPNWIGQALRVPCERLNHQIDGVEIECLAWGRRGDPGVILLHGFGAAADWWSFVAPFLAQGRRIVAPSFSGCGGSGWRESYDLDTYRHEAQECAHLAGALDGGPAVIAAHSFGATVGSRLAGELGNRACGFIVIDRPFIQNKRPPFAARAPRSSERFSTLAAAIARFRPHPPAHGADPQVIAHVASTGIRQDSENGVPVWTRRHDPDYRLKLQERQPSIADQIQALSCPTGFIRGERSHLFTPNEACEVMAAGFPVATVPDAGHHLMLEAPLALSAALADMIGGFKQG